MLKVILFGVIEAEFVQEQLAFRSDKIRALFAYLVMHPQQKHRRQFLATLLWGGMTEKQATTNLRVALNRLRTTLKPVLLAEEALGSERPFLDVTRQTVQLNLDPQRHEVDVHIFAQKIDACYAVTPADWWRSMQCVSALQTAVALHQEPFLASLFAEDCPEFEQWRTTLAETYYQQKKMAVEALAHHALALGETQQAIAYAKQQLTDEPWHEESHRVLMQAYAQMGQFHRMRSQYQAYCQQMCLELGAEPNTALTQLADTLTTARPLELDRFPQPHTPFIGRQADLHDLKQYLLDPDYRLLTVIGMGGVGKTRLALEATKIMSPQFADGAYFIPLANIISDPNTNIEAVWLALADALQFPTLGGTQQLSQQLLQYVRTKQMLLFFDNFEHVLSATKIVKQLLETSPSSKILVTSRERLFFQMEQVFQVDGLAIPTYEDTTSDSDSLQLLVERTTRVLRRFELIPTNRLDMIDICRLCEGLPLALELAAQNMAYFAPAELARYLQENITSLAANLHDMPLRHRSVQALFDYSWQYLTDQTQEALAKLTLFQGVFFEETAVAILEMPPAILTQLVDKSLLQNNLPQQYQLHSLIQQFASAKLEQNAQWVMEAEHAFMTYYANYMHQQDFALAGKQQVLILKALRQEIDHIQKAWQLAVSQREEGLLEKLAKGLFRFYNEQGWHREGLAVFKGVAVRLFGTEPPTTALHAHLLEYEAFLYYRHGQYEASLTLLNQLLPAPYVQENGRLRARCYYDLTCNYLEMGNIPQAQKNLEQAERAYTQFEEDRDMAQVLSLKGILFKRQGHYEQARKASEASLELKRSLSSQHSIASELRNLGFVLTRIGEFQSAIGLLEEALHLQRELENNREVSTILVNIGVVYDNMGQFQLAKPYYEKALKISQYWGNKVTESICLNNLGDVAIWAGDYKQAVIYLQQSLKIKQETQNMKGQVFSHKHLGTAYLSLNQLVLAQTHALTGLKIAWQLETKPLQLVCLVVFAKLWIQQKRYQEASYLLPLIKTHPAVWERTKRDASELLATLPEVYQGQSVSAHRLETLVLQLLAEGVTAVSSP